MTLTGLEVEPPYICTPWFKKESIFVSYELVKTLPDYLRIFYVTTPGVAENNLREYCI